MLANRIVTLTNRRTLGSLTRVIGLQHHVAFPYYPRNNRNYSSTPLTPSDSLRNSAPQHAPTTRLETRVKMSSMRLRIGERLKESQNTAAPLTTFDEIDMSSLISMYKDAVPEEHGVRLGFMGAFAKACTLALSEIPSVNASIEGDEIVYHNYVDLGVVVATPQGLATPVLRNAEKMNVILLGRKARERTLTVEDMSGGTFAISNGGVFNSLYGTPMINLPQSAVLGMHTVKEKPMVVDGRVVMRPVMVVALTYDHSLLDGREGTTFLVRVREYLEDPQKMLVSG
ncbi:2-oxoglutarate dehydrogenase complex E2 component [Hymenopellis radicata]|nr:2-oxoglutarate dehydrogenase complex E2 component [Hymenopellis radicata]